jgi:cell division septation protein DedD
MNVSSDALNKRRTTMSTQETTTQPASPKNAKASKKAPKTTKAATKPKKVAKTTKPKGAKSGSKAAIVLELMKRKEGATLAEIAKATDWQNHSIRGFVSGHVTKKMGLKVESTKSEAGERTYRIVS